METLRKLRALHQSAVMEVGVWVSRSAQEKRRIDRSTSAVLDLCVSMLPLLTQHCRYSMLLVLQVAAARVEALRQLEGKDEDAALFRFPAPKTFLLRVVRDEGATVRWMGVFIFRRCTPSIWALV